MKIKFEPQINKTVNKIDKNCLKNTEKEDFLDDETCEVKTFEVFDDNDELIGNAEIVISPNKAGIQLNRIRVEKDLEIQKEVVSKILSIVFDASVIKQQILVCNVYVLGSGIDFSVLNRLGFVGQSGIGSIFYSYFNPKYLEIVETLADDDNSKMKLIDYYNKYINRAKKQKEYLERELKTYEDMILEGNQEEIEKFDAKRSYQFIKESIVALQLTDDEIVEIKRS